MDLIEATRNYIDKLVQETSGMKALLLDAYTTQCVSLIYTQTEILSNEVYLIENLTKTQTHESMPHLKAVVFVQPTKQNVELIVRELSNPKFQEYHIFFSNVLPGEYLRVIAGGDSHEMVRQVQEVSDIYIPPPNDIYSDPTITIQQYFGDYMPINTNLFTCSTPSSVQMTVASNTARSQKFQPLFDRNVGCLASVLLSLKKKPKLIRYQSNSPMALQLATAMNASIQTDQIFHFRDQAPLLLILDRMDDPVTPLLSQWTYQAMVHELLGMNNNRVVLKGAPGIKKDLEEIVLSATQDEFFKNNLHSNFGELAEALKEVSEL